MAVPAARKATYEDVLAAPGAPLGTHRDGARVRAEPFEAFELDLGVLWADVDLG